MRYRSLALSALSAFLFQTAFAENPYAGALTNPQVNKDSWVMMELWPDVKDITYSSFFLDASYEKNRKLCEISKRVFDADQDARSKKAKKQFTSKRICISVSDAIAQKYISPNE